MHARRQQDSKDDSLSKGSRSNLQQYNNFDSFRERSNDVMVSSGLEIPLPVLNPAFRYSLDSRAQFPGSQRGDSNLPQRMQLSHDIDLMMPFTRNKSSKIRQSSAESSAPKVLELQAKEVDEDEVEFERAQSSIDGNSPREQVVLIPHGANDENLNINSNRHHKEYPSNDHQIGKQKRVSVARIQKNKVNFLSAIDGTNH